MGHLQGQAAPHSEPDVSIMEEKDTAKSRLSLPRFRLARGTAARGVAQEDTRPAPAPPLRSQVPFLESILQMTKKDEILFDDGNLVLKDPQLLASDVLPRYFRQGSYSTFQRQLHYFGFRKIVGKGKLEPQVFYNYSLKGKGPEALLILQRRSKVVGSGKSNTKTPVAKQPLSKYSGILPKNVTLLASSSKELPSSPITVEACETEFNGKNIPQQALIGATDWAPQKSNRYPTEVKHLPGVASASGVFSGGQDSGSSSGVGDREDKSREGSDIPLLITAFKENPVERDGASSNTSGVRCTGDRNFCGWQSPLRHQNGSRVGGVGVGIRSVGSDSEVAKEYNTGFSESGDNTDAISSDSSEIPPLTPAKRKTYEGRQYDDYGVKSATSSPIQHLPTAVQLDVDGCRLDNRGKYTATPQPLQERSSVNERSHISQGSFDNAGLNCSMPKRQSALARDFSPAVAMRNGQAPVDQFDTSSVKLVFNAQAAFPCAPSSLQSNIEGDPPLGYCPCISSDVKFDGKNFGDSILGECFATENSGDGADGMSPLKSCGDPGWKAGALSSLYTSPVSKAARRFNRAMQKALKHGGSIFRSPEQLPLTPSPLSLYYPSYRPMSSLLGF